MKNRLLAYAFAAACSAFANNASAAIQFAAPAYVVRETDSEAVVKVSLTAKDSAAGAVTVNYRTINGSADAGADYQTTAGTLIWDEGDFTDREIRVPIINDTEVEPVDETFSVVLESAAGSSISSTRSTTTVRIVDDDARQPGQFQFSASAIGILEGNVTFEVFVQRVNGSYGAVTVDFTPTTDGTATPVTDWQASAGTLVWGDGDVNPKSFTVTIFDDDIVEINETIVFRLQNPTGGATVGERSTSTVTIVDNDNPTLTPGTIRMVRARESMREDAANPFVQVERVNGYSGSVSATYAIKGVTAGPTDIRETTGIISWGDGDVDVKSIPITIVDDGLVESDETFTVTLSDPTGGAAIGEPSVETVTIIDNDVPASFISFSAPEYSVVDDQALVTVSVDRAGTGVQLDAPASVNLTTADLSAVAGQDYTSVNTTLNWNAGEGGRKSVVIPVTQFGSTPEPTEYFLVTLQAVNGSALAEPRQASVQILSHYEAAGKSTIQFNSANYSVSDREGCVALTLTRTGSTAPDISASVRVQTIDQSATQGSDYTTLDTVVRWDGADLTAKVVCVGITPPGTTLEQLETFGVRLSEPTGNGVLGSNSSATVRIQPAAPSTIRFERSVYSVGETDGSVTVTLLRGGDVTAGATVRVRSSNGSASSGTDYAAIDQQISWAPGDSSPKSLVVGILAPSSTTALAARTFSLAITAETGLVASGSPDTAAITIDRGVSSLISFAGEDSDANGVVELSVNDRDGAASITLRRVGSSIGEVSAEVVTLPGSATDAADYTGGSFTVSWANGDASPKTIVIPITGPGEAAERTEYFSVGVRSVTGRGALGSPSSVRVEIKSQTADDNKGTGCSISSGRSPVDPTLWLLALGASICLTYRRRMGRNRL